MPNQTLHSLIGDNKGNILIVEPGYGYKLVKEDYALITNFPVLTKLDDYSNPFYGKDRYDKALKILKESKEDFDVEAALYLLNSVKQDGKWGTKLSFVYSKNENAIYYCLNGDFNDIRAFRFN